MTFARLTIAALSLGLLWAPAAFAQEEPEPEEPEEPDVETEVSPQIWVDYNPSIYLTPKLNLFGDVGFRTELQSGGWWRLLLRANAMYSLSNSLRIGGGLQNFFTFNDEIDNRWELRPWQGADLVWPRWRVPLDHRLMFEERFDFNTATWEMRAALRLRYRLRATFRWDAVQEDRYWRALASTEVFMNLAGQQGQFREQVRLSAGIERSFRWTLRLRFEVAWQKEGEAFFIGRGDVSDIFFRFRIYQNWGQ
jgi:hypothetical protein